MKVGKMEGKKWSVLFHFTLISTSFDLRNTKNNKHSIPDNK